MDKVCNMSNFTIRKADPGDFAATFALVEGLYGDQQEFYEAASPVDADRLRGIWDARLRSKACAVYVLIGHGTPAAPGVGGNAGGGENADAEDADGEIYGLIAGQISKHDSRNPTHGELVGVVTEVCLAPEARGRNLAEGLLKSIEEWFRECGAIYAVADYFVGNAASARFFERSGFSPLSTRAYKNI